MTRRVLTAVITVMSVFLWTGASTSQAEVCSSAHYAVSKGVMNLGGYSRTGNTYAVDDTVGGEFKDVLSLNVDHYVGSPSSFVSSPMSGSFIAGGPCTISGVASAGLGVAFVKVSTDGGSTWHTATGTTSWSYIWTPSANGAYTIVSQATDTHNNAETLGAGINVTVDKDAPASAITVPADGAVVGGTTCTITGTASDGAGSGIAKVEVSTNGGTTWVTAAGTASWSYKWTPPANGGYAIKSRATDIAGNVQTQDDSITATFDITTPVSAVTAPLTGKSLTGTSFTITGTASDTGTGVGKVEVSVDGGKTWDDANGTVSWSFNWAMPTLGSFNIVSSATDNAGNAETQGAGVTVYRGYHIALQASPTTGGTIAVSPEGVGGCYVPGTVVSLTGTPARGYAFLGWSGSVASTKGTVSVTMNANKTVKANFKRVDIYMNPSFTQDGGKVTLSAVFNVNGSPASGKSIAFYEKTGSSAPAVKGSATTNASGVAAITFASSAGAHTAYAKYTPITAVPIDQPSGSVGITGAPAVQSDTYSYTLKKVSAVAPADKEAVTTDKPTLTWATLEEATMYRIQVAVSTTFGPTALIYDQETADTSFTISSPTLTLGKTYYWRVQASIPEGKSVYSDYRRVVCKYGTSLSLVFVSRIDNVVKVTATLTKTADGSKMPGKTLTFYENTNGGAFVSKGTAVTGGVTSLAPGVANKAWTTTIGSHNAYVKFPGDATYAPCQTDPAGVSF